MILWQLSARRRRALLAVVVALGAQLAVAAAAAGGSVAPGPLAIQPASTQPAAPPVVGADADELGTNWYPDAGISPSQVNAKDFGQLLDITLPPVNGNPAGQIYAQPIVADGVLLVVTEDNDAYGLDPSTGAVEWSRNFGPPFLAATLNCGDLAPDVGITGTPVVDTATGVAYFADDTTPSTGGAFWQMQAVHISTGNEVASFPVVIQGTATNDPKRAFNPVYEGERPGLAFVNGEVYAAFGAHCDQAPWYGWVAGVTSSGQLRDMWVAETGRVDGAGIWGPGGIVVDSAGNLYVATGNGGTPAPGPGLGVPQPSGLGECVVKLSTSGPHLALADYFCPSDAAELNTYDGDLGAGSPTGLPVSFGTTKEPDLLVEAGKSGEVYLLNRDDLGGVDQGRGGGDDVVSETGPMGGVWSHPAVWPGDGGFVYISTASRGSVGHGTYGELDIYQRNVVDGDVSLAWVGDAGATPFGSSAPIVTSDGTGAGSALVWEVVRNDAIDNGAELKAFGAAPVAGGSADPDAGLPLLFEASVGNSTKFNPPLAYDGRIYVGNFDGQVLVFGPRHGAPGLTGPAVSAPDTVLGSSSQVVSVFTATGDVIVRGVSIDVSTAGGSGAFTTPAIRKPVRLVPGGQLRLSVTFDPQVVGGQQGTLTVTTNLGTVAVPVTGRGVPEGVPIAATPTSVDFGLQPIGGGVVHETVAFENTSSSTFKVESVAIESGSSAPFTVGHLPDPLPSIAPGASLAVPVTFTPPGTSGDFVQTFTDHLVITTGAGEATVPLEGSAAPPPQITISSLRLHVGSVALGQSGIVSFTVGNRGGIPLEITKSKPPTEAGFSAVTSLAEGTSIPSHEMLVETVRFTPTRAGPSSATWVINGDDGTGVQTVTFSAKGAVEHLVPSPLSRRWRLSGQATTSGPDLQLTPAVLHAAGAGFWDESVAPAGVRASFTAEMTGGTGGSGLTFALVDAQQVPTSPGHQGPGLGLAGLPALAIALQSSPSTANPSGNCIGIAASTRGAAALVWRRIFNLPSSVRNAALRVTVLVSAGTVTVQLDGFTVISMSVHLPKLVYLGFTASTGARTDRHLVSHVQMSYR